MSTWVHPPIPPDQLRKQEEDSERKELQWYLNSLQPALLALKEGLEECVQLLAPREPGSTLVLSSLRSESVKGYVTRVGTKIVKGDIHLRLPTVAPNTARTPTNSTPSTRLVLKPSVDTSELILPQLSTIRSLINGALDIVDTSRWAGSSTDPSFIAGQLRLLLDSLTEAKMCLKGPSAVIESSTIPGMDWTVDSAAGDVSETKLPSHLSLYFVIQDANLVLTVRSLASVTPGGTPLAPIESPFSLSGFGLRSKLLGLGPRLPTHDETGQVFTWRNGQDVIVREKVRVESGDPSLLSIAAKLSALEHEVSRSRFNLHTLRGDVGDE